MPDVSFGGLAVVAAVAFTAPLLLGLAPWLRVPAVVLEIVIGIVIGPSLLGWARVDLPISLLSALGLAFLLFLAGLEIDFDRLRGRSLRLAATGFAISVAIGLGIGFAALAGGLVRSPLLVAIILAATSLGLVVPVLKDAGQAETEFGQLVIAASSVADFGAVILLSLFFSREGPSGPAKLALLVAFVLALALVAVGIAGSQRVGRISSVLIRLQDTTAEIRVRGAVLLLLAFATLAGRLGIELLLASFMAGTVIAALDRDRALTHPLFRVKLQAIGYGFLVPVFFVTSGLTFDLHALLAPSAIIKVPLFLAALLAVRGLPALLYLRSYGPRLTAAGGLLQATSLTFIVVATQIGASLRLLTQSTSAALVSAGLLSVVVFPAVSVVLARSGVTPAADRGQEQWRPDGPAARAQE